MEPKSDKITSDNINANINRNTPDPVFVEILNRLEHSKEVDLESIIDEVKTHYFEKALKITDGNESQACRMLGYKNQKTHQFKRLNINPGDYNL